MNGQSDGPKIFDITADFDFSSGITMKSCTRLYSRYSHMMMWSFMFPEIVCLFYSLYFICFKKARRPEWSTLGHHCLLEFLFA